MEFEWFMGKRFLWSSHRHFFITLITFLSVSGVAVGVAVLIAVTAVMSGAQEDIRKRILGVEAHVIVFRNGGVPENDPAIQMVRKMEGIKSVEPFIYGNAMLRSKEGISGVLIRGVAENTSLIALSKPEKLFSDPNSETGKPSLPAMVVGKILAEEELKAKPGDTLMLVSPRKGAGSANSLPEMRSFHMVDYYLSGISHFDSMLAVISLAEAQKTFSMQGMITGLQVRVEDIFQAGRIAEEIESVLKAPYYTKDWMSMNANLFSMLKIQKAVMFLILALIVLVAAFNIASTLIMTVKVKTRDISILKAMGATNKQIRRIFVTQGMVIGALGVCLGTGLGLLVCGLLSRYEFVKLPENVYFFTRLPVKVVFSDIAVILAVTMFICFLSTIYPANRATRQDPVKGIRYG